MPLHRFVIYWIVDYVLAAGIVFVVATAGPVVFGIPQISYLALLYIPLGTMFFSWLAYRGVQRESAHRLVVAVAWTGLAVLVDVAIAAVVWQIAPLVFLLTPFSIGIYGLKFFSVFIGAYLGLPPLARLERASPPSPDQRPPGQE